MPLSNLLTILLTKYKFTILLIVGFVISTNIHSQVTDVNYRNDSLNIIHQIDSTNKTIGNDSTNFIDDSIAQAKKTDSIRKSVSPNAISSKIDYKAKDSIIFKLKEKKIYLYNEVEITYETINLKAGYVEIDFNKNTIYATGILDSNGELQQKPLFTESSQTFTSTSMLYNYTTKKGLIKDIFTNEGESYIHGKTVKKLPDNTTNIKDGKYTTCDDECPHYEMKFLKAKVVPDDKIVTGPAYFVVENVPTPLIVPFGFFPNRKGRMSGVLIPEYSEYAKRGFCLQNGGYYWGINDYVDLAVRGDIFTRGSWALRALSNYKKLYNYSGSVEIGYAYNIIGEEGMSDYDKNQSYKFAWKFIQDPKARPSSSFTADVCVIGGKYNRYNSTDLNNFLTTQYNSSVAYQKSWSQGKYNLSANLGYIQNTQTHEVQLKFPEVNFSISRFYPFRSKKKVGALKWYDNISITYTFNAQNTLNTLDSILWRKENLNNLKNGIMHTIPISSSIKVMKYFNLTNTINIRERWYLKTINKNWNSESRLIATDTIENFKAETDFDYNASLTTKLYGMYQFKKGALKAIRHVLTPNIGFTYRPNFGDKFWGYYKDYQLDSLGHEGQYSIFEQGVYGGPAYGTSGSVNLSLGNNLEMKVRSKKDTVTGTKKVNLIDNLSISTNYDIAKDSLNWNFIYLNGHTRLFQNIDISFTGAFDIYAMDSATGGRKNKYEWDVNKKLLRTDNTQWQFTVNYSLNSDDIGKKRKKNLPAGSSEADLSFEPNPFISPEHPWNLNIYYTLAIYNKFNQTTKVFGQDVVQTINLNGGFNVTKKMKFSYTVGYDFLNNQISNAKIDFYRDLHCWEMLLWWIPIGYLQGYGFTLRLKASFLQDLKLEKKSDRNMFGQ